MPFTIKGKATVKQVRIKRGIKDDSPVGVVIVLEASDVSADAAAAAIGTDNVNELVSAFFKPESRDEDQSARFYGIKGIRSAQSWENHHKLQIHNQEAVRVRKVNAISLNPQSFATFDAVFSVAIDHPPKGFMEQLAEDLHSVVAIRLEHDPDLFDKQIQAEAAAHAAEPAQVPMVIPEGSPLAVDEAPAMTADEYVAANATQADLSPAPPESAKKPSKAPKPGDTDKALKALSDKAKADKAGLAPKPRKPEASKPLPKIVPRGKTFGKPPAKPQDKGSKKAAPKAGKKR